MTNLERLKLELNHKNYYEDEDYIQLLAENGLTDTDTFNKETHFIKILETVISVLEALSNDVDLMRKIDAKDITSVDQASLYLNQRISNLNARIQRLKEEENNITNINLMFYNNRRG